MDFQSGTNNEALRRMAGLLSATTMLNVIGLVLLYAGAIALLVGWIGIVFCGFSISFWRGIRNLIVPFVAFGDAYNSFPILVWMWGGGAGLIALGGLFVY